MTALLPPYPIFRAFDANGAPLAGGLLYTYAAGTTTPLATYTDSTGSTPNTNPVVLDSSGQANVWLPPGVAYKWVLEDQFGVIQWTKDQITGGIQGAAGTPGSVWRNGSGVPSNSLGVDGDYYLNDDNGDVYLRSGGAYAKVANILGPAGSSVNRIINGRFYQSLNPWASVAAATNGAAPTLGAGDALYSGGAQQYAAQSVSVAVTADGSVSQAFSIQALAGTQSLTFNTACWLESVAAQNANTGIIECYLYDGQNNTETKIGTYNFTASSPIPSWTLQTIDVTANLPIQGDYGLRFRMVAFVDNIGGSAGSKGTYVSVDDVQLVTSSAGTTGPAGPTGPQGPPGSSSGILQRVTFTAVGANTFTVPVSVNYLDVTCVAGGGGGGGGAVATDGAGGGGGGGGATVRRRIPVTPNTAYTITIGAGGLGSASGTGANGDLTKFAAGVQANGGVGGVSATGSTSPAGGAAGVGTTTGVGGSFPVSASPGSYSGLLNGFGAIVGGTAGGAGGAGGVTGANGAAANACETYLGGFGGNGDGATKGGGGGGGSTAFGQGGTGGDFNTIGGNAAAGAYGAGGGGGGGGTAAKAGGNGMSGYCIVEYIG